MTLEEKLMCLRNWRKWKLNKNSTKRGLVEPDDEPNGCSFVIFRKITIFFEDLARKVKGPLKI